MRRILAALAVLVVVAACAPARSAPSGPAGSATVVHPVDGDTVLVRIGGAEESVRLIGIDTPESVARDRPVECFGPEAKARTAELLPAGTSVRLERDVEARDQYDRLLAYVVRADDGVLVNLLLVEEGYAESAPFPPNLAHQADFDRAESAARHDRARALARLRRHGRPHRAGSVTTVTTLAERLGHGPDDRLVILNCDDLGYCQAANVGVYRALRDGLATSASLMVPCPWARDAAAAYRGDDVGVHLTLNCELDRYRWGPITHAPSLLDGDGGFPRTLTDLWEHADLDEVRRELRAQVERAILWGFDVSHLDSHMGAAPAAPRVLRRVPRSRRRVRPAAAALRRVHPARHRLPVPPPRRRGGRGVPRPPGARPRCGFAGRLREGAVGRSGPGSPSCSSTPPSTRRSCERPRRTGRAGSTTSRSSPTDDAIREAFEAAGIERIGYRPLRELQRAG